MKKLFSFYKNFCFFLLCLSSLLFAVPTISVAENVRLNGTYSQGGLVLGKADNIKSVKLDQKSIPFNENGYFLLGFGRDHPAESLLTVTFNDDKQSIQTLNISAQDYDIQRINVLEQKKVTPDPEITKRIIADNEEVKRVRQNLSKSEGFLHGFNLPADGKITGVFGSQRILNGEPRNPHKGVDIAAPIGTHIYADADGIISFAKEDMYLMGNGVMIDHGSGLQSIFIHMDKILVSEGQAVKKGDIIGHIGQTGRATGPHVHWGISLFDTALDPLLIILK